MMICVVSIGLVCPPGGSGEGVLGMCTPLVLPSTTVMVSTVYPASRIQGFVPVYLTDLNEDHTSIFMALDKE